jgi:hypothetical protein
MSGSRGLCAVCRRGARGFGWFDAHFGSSGTFVAAETQPRGPGTTLPCRDDLLGGLKERTMATVGAGIWQIPANAIRFLGC